MDNQPKYVYTGKLGKFTVGGKVISSHELEKTFSEKNLQNAVERGILKLNKRYEPQTKNKKKQAIELTQEEGPKNGKEE